MVNECQNGISPEATRRIALGETLKNCLGSESVYYQPPSKYSLTYPCITYKRARIDPTWAGNKPYLLSVGFQVTFITKDPDDPVPLRIAALPFCRLDSAFTTNNLYHYIYTIYY